MSADQSGHFHKALVGMRWIAASKLMVQASTWILTILSVRLLRPSDYGIVSMAGLITVFVNLALEGGVGISIVQKREDNRETLASLALALLFFSSLAAAVLIIAAPLFAGFFREPSLTDVLRVASLQFPLSAMCVVPASILIREMRFRELAVSQTVAAIVQGVTAVGLAYAGQAYWALVYSTLVGLVVRNLLLHLQARPPVAWRWNWQSLGPYGKSGRLLLGQRFIWFAVEEADRFLVARGLGVNGTGTFSVAKTLSHTFLDRIAEIVNQVALPAFAAKQDDSVAWKRGFLQLQSFAATLAFPLFWGLGAVAPTVLPLLLGERWNSVIPAFSLFCFVLPLRVWYSLVDNAVVASGRNYLALGNIAAWLVILLPLFVFAVPHGITWVAASWAIGFPVVYLFVSRRIARAVEVSWSQMLTTMAGPACYAAGMTAVVVGAGYLMGNGVHPVTKAVVQVPLGVVSYFGLMWIFGRQRFTEIVGLGMRFIGRA